MDAVKKVATVLFENKHGHMLYKSFLETGGPAVEQFKTLVKNCIEVAGIIPASDPNWSWLWEVTQKCVKQSSANRGKGKRKRGHLKLL